MLTKKKSSWYSFSLHKSIKSRSSIQLKKHVCDLTHFIRIFIFLNKYTQKIIFLWQSSKRLKVILDECTMIVLNCAMSTKNEQSQSKHCFKVLRVRFIPLNWEIDTSYSSWHPIMSQIRWKSHKIIHSNHVFREGFK